MVIHIYPLKLVCVGNNNCNIRYLSCFFQERTLPGFHNTNDRLGCINYDKIIKQHKSRLLQKVSSVDVLPRLEENRKQQEVKDTDNDKENDQEDTFKLPQIRKTSKVRIALVHNSKNKQTNQSLNRCYKAK